MNGSSALLPTQTTINPSQPMGAEYFEAGDVLYVVENEKGNRRVFKSSGSLGDAWAIGTTHEARHDQKGYRLGFFTVVGIAYSSVNEKSGMDYLTEGDIPQRRLPMAVFK